MTVILLDGTERRVQIGQPLAGVDLRSFVVTAGDVRHPDFLTWLLECILPRLVP
jgi:hypothetical protein